MPILLNETEKNYTASRETKGAISLGTDSFFIVVFSFILDMSICDVWMYSPSFAHRHTKSNGFKGNSPHTLVNLHILN